MDILTDVELSRLQEQEEHQVQSLSEQIEQLRAKRQRHEESRLCAQRELNRRSFKLLAGSVLPFLRCSEVLRWRCSSSSLAGQLCVSALGGPPSGLKVHHLRGLSPHLEATQAIALTSQLHWPSVETLAVDAGSNGWLHLLEALKSIQAFSETNTVPLENLRGLSVSCQDVLCKKKECKEDSVAMRGIAERIGDLLCELLGKLSVRSQSCMEELLLVDLRSTLLLEMLLQNCSRMRVCSASFIGKDVHRRPLQLPFGGLPHLECLMLKHRDFSEQRASRQDRRINVMAAPLLRCLEGLYDASRLRVLALLGMRIEGSREETASLLGALKVFSNLASLVLRFSVPLTFGALLPLPELIGLRCSWPRLGYFKLGSESIHGFDYWPSQMVDYNDVYGRRRHKVGDDCSQPLAEEVFRQELQYVLAEQYGTTASEQWRRLPTPRRVFWATIATKLPQMRRSELQQRVVAFSITGI
mmetsp:Transcript_58263/g.138804  ORF Transcript_58263/g.138804 Transcript_58263/m.138804 type:complete len:471 (+) Transcript_58263:78-1490(+)